MSMLYCIVEYKKKGDFIMASKWQYQKGKYKQINIQFRIDNDDEMILYHYIKQFDNQSEKIKMLIRDDLWRDAYENE